MNYTLHRLPDYEVVTSDEKDDLNCLVYNTLSLTFYPCSKRIEHRTALPLMSYENKVIAQSRPVLEGVKLFRLEGVKSVEEIAREKYPFSEEFSVGAHLSQMCREEGFIEGYQQRAALTPFSREDMLKAFEAGVSFMHEFTMFQIRGGEKVDGSLNGIQNAFDKFLTRPVSLTLVGNEGDEVMVFKKS